MKIDFVRDSGHRFVFMQGTKQRRSKHVCVHCECNFAVGRAGLLERIGEKPDLLTICYAGQAMLFDGRTDIAPAWRVDV